MARALRLLPLALPIAAGCAPGPLQLTLYKDDFALVTETRTLDLRPGTNRISLDGVSRELDPASLLFSFGEETKGPSVVASSYDLGVGSGPRLLQRYLGREVELVYRGEDGKVAERTKGTLIAAENDRVVVRTGDRYVVNPNATIELPLDGELAAGPSLSVEIASPDAARRDLRFSYLTRGLSWRADYALTLAPGSRSARMEAWAMVTNGSGVAYRDAALTFAAGSPNRAVVEAEERAPRKQSFGLQSLPALPASAAPEIARPAGDIVLYPFPVRTTIRAEGTTRVRLFETSGVKVTRLLSAALPPLAADHADGGSSAIAVTSALKIRNDVASGLGQPLPAGALRVFESADGAAPAYTGAGTLPDLPVGESSTLELANAFSLTARSRVVSSKPAGKKRTLRTVEVTLRNGGGKGENVRVVQTLEGVWTLASETLKGRKTDARTLEWSVPVPAKGTTTLRFAVTLTASE